MAEAESAFSNLQAQNLAGHGLGCDLDGPAANLAIEDQALLRATCVDQYLAGLTTPGARDFGGDFHGIAANGGPGGAASGQPPHGVIAFNAGTIFRRSSRKSTGPLRR
jgi:hypothetical protein